MTRKEYAAIAQTIIENLTAAKSPVAKAAVAKVARDLADTFKTMRSEFRYDRFFAACGLDKWGEVVK